MLGWVKNWIEVINESSRAANSSQHTTASVAKSIYHGVNRAAVNDCLYSWIVDIDSTVNNKLGKIRLSFWDENVVANITEAVAVNGPFLYVGL